MRANNGTISVGDEVKVISRKVSKVMTKEEAKKVS